MLKTANPILRKIGEISDEMAVDVYAVGGFVRDRVMKRQSQEIDFVVEGDAPAFAAAARERLGGYGFVVFPKFGTASFQTGDRKLEFVTARKETYRKQSRKPHVIPASLEEDLKRRDFTINTMALILKDPRFGEIIDPFGGAEDIRRRTIRTPLDPETTFFDDPLRIMRAARFAGQLSFTIDPVTLKAMEKERERLGIVSQERITDEMLKMLSFPQPSIGFRILKDTHVLDIVFPELASLSGIEQREEYQHKDVLEHSLKVLDKVAEESDNLYLRFTALVHDIGKPRVKRFVEGTGWTFYGHELIGVRMLRTICQRLKLSKEFYKYASGLTRLHMRPIQLIGEEVTDSALRRLLFHAGEGIDDLMLLCRADITSGNPERVKIHLQNFNHVMKRMQEVEAKDRVRAFQSPVRGEEIMAVCGIGPGPEVGKLKKMIEEAILDGKIPNEHDAAYAYLIEIKKSVLGKE